MIKPTEPRTQRMTLNMNRSGDFREATMDAEAYIPAEGARPVVTHVYSRKLVTLGGVKLQEDPSAGTVTKSYADGSHIVQGGCSLTLPDENHAHGSPAILDTGDLRQMAWNCVYKGFSQTLGMTFKVTDRQHDHITITRKSGQDALVEAMYHTPSGRWSLLGPVPTQTVKTVHPGTGPLELVRPGATVPTRLELPLSLEDMAFDTRFG